MTARALIPVAAAMLLIGAFSEWRFFGPVPEESPTLVASIPQAFEGWAGQDVALDERTYEILETRNVLYREYRTTEATDPVTLCIVFARANRKAPHPPEVCYTGAGAHVDKRPQEPVDVAVGGRPRSLLGNSLFVGFGPRREVVLYWYLAGTELTTSYYGQQLRIMWAQMTGRPAQSALIRYSTPVGDESSERAMARLKAFAKTSLPEIVSHLTQ